MKTSIIATVILFFAFAITSCKKCSDCHYDTPSGEIELGEYCDDDLEDIEANGYHDADTTYDVHCSEHE